MSSGKIKRPEIIHNLELLKMLVRQIRAEWVVIHTKPKCERRALDAVMAAGFFAYLPIACEERKYGVSTRNKPNGTYLSKRPMFPRYLFAGIDLASGRDLGELFDCDGVEGVVSFGENEHVVRVNPGDLCKVLDTSHATFEGEEIPNKLVKMIADLPDGSKLGLVSGDWSGFQITKTGYDDAKERVLGLVEGSIGQVKMSVPVDAVDIKSV